MHQGLHAEEGLLRLLRILHGPVGGLFSGPQHEPVHHQRQSSCLHALRQVSLPPEDEGLQRARCWRPLSRLHWFQVYKHQSTQGGVSGCASFACSCAGTMSCLGSAACFIHDQTGICGGDKTQNTVTVLTVCSVASVIVFLETWPRAARSYTYCILSAVNSNQPYEPLKKRQCPSPRRGRLCKLEPSVEAHRASSCCSWV